MNWNNVTMNFLKNHNVRIRYKVYVDRNRMYRIRITAKPIVVTAAPWL